MRLKHYLNESLFTEEDFENISEIMLKIKNDCQYFLNQSKGAPLFRGMKYFKGTPHFGTSKVRKDRMPSGTPKWLSDDLNKWLIKNGHADRRKSLITSTHFSHCTFFGNTYVIFPKGKFKYSWCETEDFNSFKNMYGEHTYDGNSNWDVASLYGGLAYPDKKFEDTLYVDQPNGRIKNKEQAVEILKNHNKMIHTNKNLKDAIKWKYEVWVDCDEYYYIDFYKYKIWLSRNK